MTDYLNETITCADGQGIVSATNAVVVRLPVDVKKQLNRVFSAYLHRYGIDGVFERFNNRTVGRILADFDLKDDVTPIASGEVNGLRYALYDPPLPPSNSKKC